jgi:hypothetical protein
MHSEDVAPRTVEPGDDDDFVTCSEPLQALEHRRLEREPRIRRPFVALPGGRGRIGQRRFDPSDRRHLEARHV